jgi:hypothetical protein
VQGPGAEIEISEGMFDFSTPIASYTADSQIPGEFKGTGSRDRIQIFGQKLAFLVVNKYGVPLLVLNCDIEDISKKYYFSLLFHLNLVVLFVFYFVNL